MSQNSVQASTARDALGIDTADTPAMRVSAPVEPSADLLDRALVGWKRFVASIEGPSGD